MKSLIRAVCLALMFFTAGPVQADIVFTSDRGWYSSTGYHAEFNTNYVVYSDDSTRDFFVFDLSGVSTSQIITSARLRLWNPIENAFTGTATYSVYDVSTSIPTLTGGGTGLVATFEDLGTGTNYANGTITSADAGTFVTVNLDTTGLTALNAARGGTFATGGRLTSTNNVYVFGYSQGNGPSDGNTSLVFEIQSIPEPASIFLCSIGALGIGLVAGRKKILAATV